MFRENKKQTEKDPQEKLTNQPSANGYTTDIETLDTTQPGWKLIVHAATPDNDPARQITKLGHAQILGSLGVNSSLDRQDNMGEDPNNIQNKEIISSSLISAEHMKTFRACGFILQIESLDDIIFAQDSDAGALNGSVEHVMRRKQAVSADSLDVMLKSPSREYNELVLDNTNNDVEVVGIFIRTKGGKPVDRELATHYETLSQQGGLKIFYLDEPAEVLEEQNITRIEYEHKISYSFTTQNTKFSIYINKDKQDISFYSGHEQIDSKELSILVKFLRKSGVSESILREIPQLIYLQKELKKQYYEAVSGRQQLKINSSSSNFDPYTAMQKSKPIIEMIEKELDKTIK